MLKTIAIALVVTASGAGVATAAPLVVQDPTELRFHLANEHDETETSKTAFYKLRVRGLVVANAAEIKGNDRVTLTWSAGGKKLEEVDCPLGGAGDHSYYNCDGQIRHSVYGEVEATFTYTVDAEDATVTLSTHRLKVGRFWKWYVVKGKTKLHASYQVMPLDLLANGIVWHEDRSSGDRRVHLYTWVSGDDETFPKPTTMRCTVDGKRIRDLEASTAPNKILNATEGFDPTKPYRSVNVYMYDIWVTDLAWGKAADLDDGHRDNIAKGTFSVMGDHPGQWSCDLRDKGKVARTLQFVVTPEGIIAPHPEQGAGFTLPGSEAMIDVLIPESATDLYVDPAAIQATAIWGQAWKLPDTGARLAPKFSRPGFESAPPKGATGGTQAKPVKAKAKAKGKGKGKGK